MRTLLSAPTSFYCDTVNGNLSNDGLSATTPLPQPQDVIELLYRQYDLGGFAVDIFGANNQQFGPIALSGALVGQRGPNVTFHCGSLFGLSSVTPPSLGQGRYGSDCIALSYGAMLTVTNATLDNSQAIAQGGLGGDVIALGQGARIVLLGQNKLIQNTIAFNHITADACCTIDVVPTPGGSAQFHFAGYAQCGIQLDAASAFQADCNGAHGIVAFWADAWNGQSPYWADAFVDVATASKVLLAGVDFHGPGRGYRYRVREGGTLDLNTAGDPNQINVLFGSAPTAWPVQGYLV